MKLSPLRYQVNIDQYHCGAVLQDLLALTGAVSARASTRSVRSRRSGMTREKLSPADRQQPGRVAAQRTGQMALEPKQAACTL
eukprot:15411015-Heterocapsa_arctica.AAC.1